MANTCKLNYIEDLPAAVLKVEKARLTQSHFNVGKLVTDLKDANGNALFTLRNAYIRYNPGLPSTYAEQKKAIEDLNKTLNGTDLHPVVFEATLADGSLVVGIDVRPLIRKRFLTSAYDPATDDSNLTGFGVNELEAAVQTDLVRNLRNVTLTQNPAGDYDYVDAAHRDLFVTTVDSLKDKLRVYVSRLRDGSVTVPSQELRIRELEDQLAALEDVEALATVEAVSAYIVQASGWLDAAHKNFFDGEGSVVERQKKLDSNESAPGVPLTAQEREALIKSVSEDLHRSKHYMYLFNALQHFQEGLRNLNYSPAGDKTVDRGEAFTADLNRWLNQSNVSAGRKAVINDFLNDPLFTIDGLRSVLVRQISEMYPGDETIRVSDDVAIIINHLTANYPGTSAESVLQAALNKSVGLKTQLADYHYKLVASWIWPKIEEKQRNYTGKFKLEKKDIIDLLKSASEDEGIFQYGLDAPIQSSDPVMAVIANLVSDTLYEAAAESRIDVAEMYSIREALNLEKTMSAVQRDAYHKQMTYQNILVLEGDEGGPVDAAWTGPTLTLDVWHGRPVTIKGYYKQALLQEYNSSLYEANRQYFYRTLNAEVSTLTDLVDADADGNIVGNNWQPPAQLLTHLLNQTTDPYAKAVLAKLFYATKTGYKMRTPLTTVSALRASMSTAMRATFEVEHKTSVTGLDRTALLTSWGAIASGASSTMNSNIQLNSSGTVIRGEPETARKKLIDPLTPDAINKLVSYQENGKSLVYVQRNSGDPANPYLYGWVDVNRVGVLDGVSQVYYATGALTRLNSRYHITTGTFGAAVAQQWQDLQQDAEKLNYFEHLSKKYQQGNENLGEAALKHGVLPQVEKLTNVDIAEADWLKRLWNWVNQHTFINSLRKSWQFVAGAAEPDQEAGKRKVYVNNEPVKAIRARFTTDIPDTELEQDLFRSILMYKAGSNHYRALQTLDKRVQAVKTLLTDDTVLGINERKATARVWEETVLNKVLKRKEEVRAKNLNKKLGAFLDDVIYGESAYAATQKIGNKTIDLNKVGGALSGFTAFSSLAWNISSAFGNIGVGFLANYSESVKGKYYRPEHWISAQKEYWRLTQLGGFYKDLSQSNPDKKSMLTQLSIRFDGIQGELLDDQGNISTTGTTEKMMNRALFFTQSGAEHLIQTVSMVAQLKGFKLADGQRTLWDAVQYTEGQPIAFDNVTPEEMRQFQQQLHSVNKQLHGHYAQFDKAVMQRHWLGQLAMMFKKYIYSSLRYRFSGERFDWEAGDETEGHLRSYWKQMLTELHGQQSSFAILGTVINSLALKPTAGAVDQLLGGVISRNSNAASQYLYGDEGQTRNAAARQTSFDVLWYGIMVMLAAFVHGLDDDDDPNGKVLMNLEIFARRMQGDLGMYLPGYLMTGPKTAFTTYDKTMQIIKSPFAQLRSYDGSVALLSQLLGVEYDEEGVNFTFNDQYTKSGSGYDKGDYKIQRKVEKSLLGPYYQIVRFFSPQGQLDYFNLSRRNSQ